MIDQPDKKYRPSLGFLVVLTFLSYVGGFIVLAFIGNVAKVSLTHVFPGWVISVLKVLYSPLVWLSRQ